LDDTDRLKLEVLVKELGSEDFDSRETASQALVARGRLALPFLRTALSSKDAETIRRARDCITAIENGPGPILSAAVVRVVARKRPEGAVEVLLRFIPFADDEALEDDTFEALAQVGLREGKIHPLLLKAKSDVVPARRAAAGLVLGRATEEATRDNVIR